MSDLWLARRPSSRNCHIILPPPSALYVNVTLLSLAAPVPEGDCYVGGPKATEEPSSWENKEKLLISMEMGKHRRRAKLEPNPTVNGWGQILWQINKNTHADAKTVMEKSRI